MAFKMKGSPMKRNFGVGSPMKKGVSGPARTNPETKDPNRIPVPDSFEVGSLVSEDWLESQFDLKTGDSETFPQVSVQDYSEVRKDADGNLYVEKIPQTESHR